MTRRGAWHTLTCKYFKGVVLASLSYYRSNHSLNLGYQFNRSYVTTKAFSLSGGIRAVFPGPSVRRVLIKVYEG